MKHLLKTCLLIAATLSSCFSSEEKSSKPSVSTYPTSTNEELTYDDVKDKMIYWSNIFAIDSNAYYVYFFSKTCTHCQNLKPLILKEAIKRDDIYFVEESKEVVFVKNTSSTIGLTSIEGFGIIGYPSLVKIEEKTLTKNLAGIPSIRSELSIE